MLTPQDTAELSAPGPFPLRLWAERMPCRRPLRAHQAGRFQPHPPGASRPPPAARRLPPPPTGVWCREGAEEQVRSLLRSVGVETPEAAGSTEGVERRQEEGP